MSAGNETSTTHDGEYRQPVQARARRTFQKILDAALEILVDEGVNALNTNKIADNAGVNIATLYSYFPNKEAILSFLAQRFENQRASSVEEHATELGRTGTWQEWFSESIDSMVDFRLKEPGGLAVRQALMALPDLHDLDQISTRRAIEAKIPGLIAINPQLTEVKARAISHVYTVSATAILDESFRDTPYDAAAIEEFKRMVLVYLGSYLSPSKTASPQQ